MTRPRHVLQVRHDGDDALDPAARLRPADGRALQDVHAGARRGLHRGRCADGGRGDALGCKEGGLQNLPTVNQSMTLSPSRGSSPSLGELEARRRLCRLGRVRHGPLCDRAGRVHERDRDRQGDPLRIRTLETPPSRLPHSSLTSGRGPSRGRDTSLAPPPPSLARRRSLPSRLAQSRLTKAVSDSLGRYIYGPIWTIFATNFVVRSYIYSASA